MPSLSISFLLDHSAYLPTVAYEFKIFLSSHAIHCGHYSFSYVILRLAICKNTDSCLIQSGHFDFDYYNYKEDHDA